MFAGCANKLVPTANYVYKNNPVTLAQKDKDIFDCKLAAAQAVPTDTVVSKTPTYTTPVTCSNYGYSTSCYGGNTIGGNIVTNDRNSGLKLEYENRCLANRGYKKTTFPIPQCDLEDMDVKYSMDTLVRKPVAGSCWVWGTNRASFVVLPEDQ